METSEKIDMRHERNVVVAPDWKVDADEVRIVLALSAVAVGSLISIFLVILLS